MEIQYVEGYKGKSREASNVNSAVLLRILELCHEALITGTIMTKRFVGYTPLSYTGSLSGFRTKKLLLLHVEPYLTAR